MGTITSGRARLLRDLSISLVSGLILAVGGGIYATVAMPSITASVPLWIVLSSTATVAGTVFAFSRTAAADGVRHSFSCQPSRRNTGWPNYSRTSSDPSNATVSIWS
ncbi:hypothetical protein [Acrocarpospora corrugata]|uniref:hypothetical protein n=1 Tax=Acrocarpospora corrugata TaxID=35763 RepID=UPI0012D36B1C|nr:hypothetical protein [Acrocarpospora corrugata]